MAVGPLVSVLAVVYNDRDELERILTHVAPFREGGRLEMVVVDGGSTDGTLDLLQRLSHKVDFWISEPDRGIYDAMNKAVAVARGRYVLHINAGDTLLDVPWQHLLDSTSPAWVSGQVREDGGTFFPRLSWISRFANTLHHQGSFFRRDLHLGYKTGYRVYADFEHHQRLLRAGVQPLLLTDFLVAEHAGGGISSDSRWVAEETRSVRENYGWLHSLVPRAMVPVRYYRGLLQRKLARWAGAPFPQAAEPNLSLPVKFESAHSDDLAA